jgi:hypothetical protein
MSAFAHRNIFSDPSSVYYRTALFYEIVLKNIAIKYLVQNSEHNP